LSISHVEPLCLAEDFQRVYRLRWHRKAPIWKVRDKALFRALNMPPEPTASPAKPWP